ncbi:MAG: DUF362 domain-containing protein [Candidatus Thorarchaeota archaeon]|nr:MAG: DUF362 domain-containing protein [Candidatus Thorarchaeota archaeon]
MPLEPPLMNHDSERHRHHNEGKTKNRRRLVSFMIIALASTVWFVLRTGTKPSRVLYPCQQAALANISIFKTVASISLPSIASLRVAVGAMKPIMILVMLSVGGFIMAIDPFQIGLEPLQIDSTSRVPISLVPHNATFQGTASDLFYVQNATGPAGSMDSSMTALLDLMASQGLYFYNTTTTPDGLIGSEDVIIIKMNGQWQGRGGTNTDLIKSVINTIINHPDGFTGEVVIADNGQGLGMMNPYTSNSYYQNQSAYEVAEFFASEWNVSSMVWDGLRGSTVDDYNNDDFANGYVRSSVWNNDTQLFVSYPKFQSPATGAYISFKQGIWNNDTGFDSGRLKVINMPVLKTHFRYGVSGCIKHYMGVPQGYIVESVDPSIPHEHFSIGEGGMGTLMAETRAPVLNILDMVWVNAHPLESSSQTGPWSMTSYASTTDIIGASIDPVALDYWSAKHILLPTAEYLNYTDYSSINPDDEAIHVNMGNQQIEQDESFHNYLERSMNELKDAGFQVTMFESEMNVFVLVMTDAGPITPTIPEGLGFMVYLPVVIGAVVLVLMGVAVVMKRRRT